MLGRVDWRLWALILDEESRWKNCSRLKAPKRPACRTSAFENQPIVQTVLLALPKPDVIGCKDVAAPRVRPRNLVSGKAFVEVRHALDENVAPFQRCALFRRPS